MDLLIDTILPERWRPVAHSAWENRGWFVVAFIIAMLIVAVIAGNSAYGILIEIGRPKL